MNTKKYDMTGSLTVEASMLIPFLFFLLAAIVLMIMNCRSAIVLESNIMMESEAEVMNKKNASVTGIILNKWSATASGSGMTYSLFPGIRQMIGGDLTYSSEITSIRINYVDDWYRSVFMKR